MKNKTKRSSSVAYMMLTCQNFRPRYTASKKEQMNKRSKKINKNNYKDYFINGFSKKELLIK